MASTFPGAIDSFTDPLSNSPLNSPSHSAQHADLNDAVEKLETYTGLVKVIPTSVSSAGGTSATLGATGTVTVGTSNTSVTVNGCFSSLYNVYKVVMNGGVCGGNSDFQIQLNGITTGVYAHNLLYMTNGSSTVTGFNQTTQTSWNYCGGGSVNNTHMSCEIFAPNSAKFKSFVGAYFFPTSMAGVGYYQSGGVCESTIQATGFKVTVSGGGTVTGASLTVYGYRI